MIGLVVVSHSARAAEGICEVALEMAADAQIEPAGGEDGGLGTDAGRIRDAIEAADDGDGVVVLVDLGSAVMNAELAIEMSDADAVIADAPVLEGTVNAGVETTSGKATLDSVVERAEEAREYRKLD
ncbi:PTS mannose transporter subunit IID [Halobiforma lacisalsi AJ5]|uniref:phosphoenolpyruvate--glycerone phosphotransferase n=1 Tax=Natronobacterium lacisalsi AJ5 TaxID=358396 RepID=M0LJJ0_NATLA|nr:dihydroxyacetone kinase phosphoryl donor subunit DhaM [Halobiforma lacisalsi]APW98459.1 PTS mannose transporter subunit IID [Halobiforma lacisalsi AJ5]EMA33233.1 dihydroxyacetone kinase phosphotransfer subunit [Halobiforma lacisalsi AJ5]